jgi:hypothetical protein
MAYPEDKKRLEKRDEELRFERMDNMLVSMYVQWNDDDPEFKSYAETKKQAMKDQIAQINNMSVFAKGGA